MALPDFTMRQLLEAGVHFGHQTHRWNPKMAQYIYGSRNNIHIIDLSQTKPMLDHALQVISDTVAGGGRVLMVGTKRQAADAIAEAARRSAQYYVNSRWLGGMLTNWKTISRSIARLRKVQETLEADASGFTKKERLSMTRERDKLERALGGIKDMGGLPEILFVIDTNKESIAIKEARRLGIPVVAIVDTNCDPDPITYPVPGNDDAGRAISFYCDLVARAVIDGISRAQGEAGIDVGEAEEPPMEPVAEEGGPSEPVSEEPASAEAAPEEPAETAPEEPAGTAPEEPVSGETDTDRETGAGSFRGLEAPRGEADDLTRISGVGPALEKKLHDMGIYHFWQIAELTAEDVAAVDAVLNFKGRIEREDWIGQARALAAESA